MMSWLAPLVLYFIHAVYVFVNLASSLRECFFARKFPPRPLLTQRKQVPRHLAVLLASETDDHELHESSNFEQEILDNVEEVVNWCQVAGIQRLTLYDRQGILSRLSFEIRSRLLEAADNTTACTSDSEPEYPLTPPLSDDSASSSRSLSPKQDLLVKLQVSTLKLGEQLRRRRNSGRGVAKRRTPRKSLINAQSSDSGRTSEGKESNISESRPITLHVISRATGKPGLAEAANSLAANWRRRSPETPHKFKLSIEELQLLVEGENGFPSPDMMLIHPMTRRSIPKNVLELHGFPPWHMSLTEFHYSLYPQSWWNWSAAPSYIPLRETDFRRALDQYDSAEMRHGK